MPELPEVEALAAFLRENAVGRVADAGRPRRRVQAIKTFDPPLSALGGLEVTGAGRHGKFLDLDVSGLHLVVHLARAGWLHWRDRPAAGAAEAGQGPARAARAPRRRRAASTSPSRAPRRGSRSTSSASPAEVPGHRPARPRRARRSTASSSPRCWPSRSGQLKGVLTDQTLIAGIGNAYSDEILHAARLSPFKMADKLDDDEVVRLYDAMRADADRRAATASSGRRPRR